MIPSPSSFRRLLALTSALSMALPATGLAQDAGDTAPPATVGQITSLSGSVSFNGSGSGGWAAAAENYPVSAGDSLYTQDGSRAGIALQASQITLASDTELQVTGLDDRNFAATLSQGEAALTTQYLEPGQVFTLSTPRGTVRIVQDGAYDIIAGDADNPTVIDVFQGAATVTAPGLSLQVTAGQAAILSGSDQTIATVGAAQQDAFAAAVLTQNAPPPPYAPPIVNQMTGVGELGQYGSWQQSPQYGAVWYPSVGAGWAPYRQGHWANIQPWGWTWVESEPWGFAPFHYGRWIDTDDRWGWAPAPAYAGGYGPSYQPVYAPAVVGFFGVALAAGITAAVLSSGSVGWVPLAPGEPYYPTYRCPPAYFRQINVVNVRNIEDIHVTNNYYGSNFSPDRLANRRAATFVPADVMSRGEHVAGFARTPPQNELAAARPIDTGFGNRSAPPAGQAAFRLPASRPMAELRPGAAPRPSDFAERHIVPPASLSHTPIAGQAAPLAPHADNRPFPAANRPNFATAPGYRPPPPPPAAGQHPGGLPPAGNFHPATEPRTAPSFEQRPAQEYHPAPIQNFHPAQVYHPPAEAYHPPVEAYHPPAQQFRPQQIAQPRPMQQQRPMEQARPQEHHEPSHQGGDKRPN